MSGTNDADPETGPEAAPGEPTGPATFGDAAQGVAAPGAARNAPPSPPDPAKGPTPTTATASAEAIQGGPQCAVAGLVAPVPDATPEDPAWVGTWPPSEAEQAADEAAAQARFLGVRPHARPEPPVVTWWEFFGDVGMILLGVALMSAGIAVFLVPNNIVTGGVTGLAILSHHATGVPVGLALMTLNIPIFVLGWRYCGGRAFFLRTLIGVAALSVGVEAAGWLLPPFTGDRLLLIFYGGILDGLGLAIVFRGRGTTGGIDVIGRMLKRRYDLDVGQSMLLLNALVYGLAAWRFGLEAVMLAFLLAFVSSQALDKALQGLDAARMALIISPEHAAIRQAILTHLGRGVTVLDGRGGWSDQARPVLYVVVARHEVARLRQRILEQDPNAFVSILHAQSVTGGFAVPRPRH